jgi:hypothetical protein
MTSTRRELITWSVIAGVLLLMANLLVAVRHLGTRAGQTYRWVSPDSGAELTYNPSQFGSAKITGSPRRGSRWELIEPLPPSPKLPWNWLAFLLDRPAPDPESVIRQEHLAAD